MLSCVRGSPETQDIQLCRSTAHVWTAELALRFLYFSYLGVLHSHSWTQKQHHEEFHQEEFPSEEIGWLSDQVVGRGSRRRLALSLL